ncbi:MAG TPA: TolC family protein, partial [Nitrospira sp.]|nr:TolC family protein [Nitrospira sp.]
PIMSLLGTMVFVSGCMVKPYVLTQDEIQSRVAKDRETLSTLQEPLSRPVDLYEAIARALKYNLDAKVKAMQAQLAHQQLNVAHYTLLPQLSANAGFDGRNSYSGGGAQSLLDGRPVLEPFTSSDKNVVSGNLALSWDVLDFGLSYVRAQQAADNVMIAEEERRRIAVRLVQDVRSAYSRAVSAERVLYRVKFLDESVGQALERAQQIVDKKLQTPLTPLNYRRDLLNIQREVQRLYRELSTARVQLASMMGLPPGTEYELAMPQRTTTLPVVNLNTEEMEEQALLLRAELRSIDYQKRINAKEARAVFLELFPSFKMSVGGYYSSNSFLLYQNWLGYASQVSWNLLSAFRVPAKLKAVEAHGQVLDAQSTALTMTILTEVHVGALQFAHASQEYLNAKSYHETQLAITDHTKNLWLTKSTNDLTFIRERVNDVLAEVRMDSAQSGVESAYATLMASLGEDAAPTGLDGQSVAQLADELRKQWTLPVRAVSDAGRRPESHAMPLAN